MPSLWNVSSTCHGLKQELARRAAPCGLVTASSSRCAFLRDNFWKASSTTESTTMTAVDELIRYWGTDASPEGVPDRAVKDLLDFVLAASDSDYRQHTILCTGADRVSRKIRLVAKDVNNGIIVARLLGREVPPLIHRQTAHCLADLGNSYENQLRIASFSGVLGSLVSLLERAGGSIVHEQAAKCLANLAQTRENHVKIASSSVLDALVKSLIKDPIEVRLLTLRCLTNLAESEGMRITSYPGALDALVQCMGNWGRTPTHTKAQKQAAKCLTKLASMQENQLLIVKYPGALDTVMRLLGRNGTSKVQRQAARLLIILSDHYQSNNVCIASYPGVLDAFSRILTCNWITTQRISVQLEIARCLSNLASAGDNLQKICYHDRALDAVVKCLDPNKGRIQKVQELAVRCLDKLASASQNVVRIVSWPDAIPALVRLLLHAKTPSGRDLAVSTLSKLASAQETKVVIASDPLLLNALTRLLKRASLRPLHLLIVTTITSLAQATDNKLRIASHHGVLSAFLKLAKTNADPEVCEKISKCMSFLAGERHNMLRRASDPANTFEVLIKLCNERRGMVSFSMLDPDDWFVDPITYEVMCDPVKGSDGRTYDRWTIIDNRVNRSPYDPSLRTFKILCDDIDVRRRLFLNFPEQEAKFRIRRVTYREMALENAGREDLSAIEELTNVLKWVPSDAECKNELKRLNLMDQSACLLTPPHERRVLTGRQEPDSLSSLRQEDRILTNSHSDEIPMREGQVPSIAIPLLADQSSSIRTLRHEDQVPSIAIPRLADQSSSISTLRHEDQVPSIAIPRLADRSSSIPTLRHDDLMQTTLRHEEVMHMALVMVLLYLLWSFMSNFLL